MWLLHGQADKITVACARTQRDVGRFTLGASAPIERDTIDATMIETIETRCCIAGGGPAGMMLGFLLARAGIDVVVLEKHADFLRDFRGDTIHPSTLEIVDELGLIEDFLRRPHHKVRDIEAVFGETRIPVVDFRHLPVAHPYVAFMPQWDFLSFLSEHAARHAGFHLRMSCEATRLIVEDGTVRGLAAHSREGEMAIRAELTIAADGRDSCLRDQSELPLENFGAPMDVLWFRLDRPAGHADQPLGRFVAGKILIMIDRGDYWQCGYVIPKGLLEDMRTRPFAELRRGLVQLLPDLESQLEALGGWDDLSLLNVQVNRLVQWYRPGMLCIGDAAHAMSPVAGVGINLAVQDAVAAANVLVAPLRDGRVHTSDLAAVQRRREWPTRVTQRLQLVVQNRVISRVLHESQRITPPLVLRLFRHLPFLRRIPARLIGLGIRPEHVRKTAHDSDASRNPSSHA